MGRLATTIIAILAALTPLAYADPPASAHVDVPNSNGVGGACYLNSLGQLVTYRNPAITSSEVLALSGIGTTVGWGGSPGRQGLCAHPRGFTEGIEVDLLRLCGVDYQICYGKGGAVGSVIARAAAGVTVFQSEAEAIVNLKTQLAAGNPAQVHIDMYYVWDDIAAVYPLWTPGAKFHGSHSIVVNGYDADHVYLTDSNMPGPQGETGENIPVSWEAFLTAWRETPSLSPIRGYWFGPYYQCYLTSDPVKIDSEWAMAWLGLDTMTRVSGLVVGPPAIRAAAEAIRSGRSVQSVVPGFSGGVMMQSRAMIVPFFEDAGRQDIADLYERSAGLMYEIFEDPSDPTAADKIDEMADIEEEAIALMQAEAANVEPLQVIAPADAAHLASLECVPFHWIALPGVKSAALELAMTGDFGAGKNCKTLKPKYGNWFVSMPAKSWLSVLSKDGGDRQLLWRATGAYSGASIAGSPRELTWDVQAMEAGEPADGYTLTEGELLRFTWQAPAIVLKPRVVISATDDFSDSRRCVFLSAVKGSEETFFRSGTLAQLRAKDDGNGIVYWRVEDASAKMTTVEPSETRTLNLP